MNKPSARRIRPLALLLLLSATCANAQVTLTVGLNFIGSSFTTNSTALPPDGNGVIGPTRFMEFVNGSIGIYNRTNGLPLLHKSDLKFWADAGLIIPADYSVSDPRVIYDPGTKRWFATQVDFYNAISDPTADANDFLLAVSATANPAGPWKAFIFQSDPDNGFFADFPTLGLDSNAVYISGDFFSFSDPMGPGLVSIPKADLTNASPTIANMTWYGVMDYDVRGDVMQPAVCLDGSVNGSILAMGDIGSDSNPHSNIVWSAVQNGGTPFATLSAPINLTVTPYQVPDNDDLGVPQFTALQPDHTSTLQANDPRLSAKVFAVNGVLYAVNNTELNGHIAIRWYRIRASDQTVLEQGTISDPNLDLFFPSIAANPYGIVVVCCNGSGNNTYISSYAYAGQTVNGHTTFGSHVLLASGANNYHDQNEILSGLLGGGTTPSRWGDYSTLSVDPNDPTQFWTIQTYPSDLDDASGLDDGIWAERITQLTVTAPPQVNLARVGTNVLISWPAYAGGYKLYATGDLRAPVSWSVVNQTTTTNGLQISATIPMARTNAFYRLQQ